MSSLVFGCSSLGNSWRALASFVQSLARPGGNVTGLAHLGIELGGKRLELLKEGVPKLTRIAVLYSPTASNVAHVKEVLPVTARGLKLTLQPWEIGTANDFKKLFATVEERRTDGLIVLPGGALMRSYDKRIIYLALKSRLPSMFFYKEAVEAGGLMSYGADQAESYRRVAYFVERILKGTKPANLPVEQTMKFELVINLKTATQIGVTIPQWTLMKADRVIR